ncbi:MAG: heme-copper oxidase subunit III [Candidatus Eisenbacteria bacterium]|nr:heme-copper oxidase subunit III [Candidatus Eisenbacteria bacterium]
MSSTDKPPLKLVQTGTPSRSETIPGANLLGTIVLIGSLGMLFVASMVGYFYVRARAVQWPPSGMPGMPASLWVSTALLIACSWTIHRAVLAARHDRRDSVLLHTRLTLGLGLAFLAAQCWNWWELVGASLTPQVNLYGFTFYMLTGLHAGHVIGGLIPLAIVTRKAQAGAYTSFESTGLRQCALYWHFLDAVWIVVFLVLLLGS